MELWKEIRIKNHGIYMNLANQKDSNSCGKWKFLKVLLRLRENREALMEQVRQHAMPWFLKHSNPDVKPKSCPLARIENILFSSKLGQLIHRPFNL